MKCEECNVLPAVYNLYKINKDLSKTWLKVCRRCEKIIATMNLKRQGYNNLSGRLK